MPAVGLQPNVVSVSARDCGVGAIGAGFNAARGKVPDYGDTVYQGSQSLILITKAPTVLGFRECSFGGFGV